MSLRARFPEITSQVETALNRAGIQTPQHLAGLEAGRVPEVVRQANMPELTTNVVLELSEKARRELAAAAAAPASTPAPSWNGGCSASIGIESARRELNDIQLKLKDMELDVRHGYLKAAGVASAIISFVALILGFFGYSTVKDLFADVRTQIQEEAAASKERVEAIEKSVTGSNDSLASAVRELSNAKDQISSSGSQFTSRINELRSDIYGLRSLLAEGGGSPGGVPQTGTTNPVELTMQLQAAVRSNDIPTITSIIPNLLLLIEQLTPSDLHTLAWACLSINDHQGAIRAATKGITRLSMQEVDGMTEFDKALLASLYSKRGTAFAEAKATEDQALADFDRAIELYPLDEALNNQAGLLWKLGQFKEAVEALERAIEIDDEPTGRDNLALTYLAWYQSNDASKPSDLLEKALAEAEKAFKAKSDDKDKAQSALIAAMVSAAKDDSTVALAWCEKALTLDRSLRHVAGGILNTNDPGKRIEALRVMIAAMGPEGMFK